ncbi:hypothetical protein C1I88_07440 [Akkermansia muciniphila]|nr:hypothetical protein C1I88_07440 [Akkermansia muciniphila]
MVTRFFQMKPYPCQMVQAVAVIVERIADTAFRATLPNGKPAVAFVEKKNASLRDLLKPGDRVKVTICPADFDRARVDGLAE